VKRSAKKYFLPFGFLLLITALIGCQKEPELTREEYVQYIVGQVRSESLESYVRWLEGMGTRFALADNRREIAVRIRNRFIALGYPQARLDSFYMPFIHDDIDYSNWQYNVIASLDGRQSDSICIVGAHYDDIIADGNPFIIAPGANDNASGVAALLEMARIIRKNHFQPKYDIRFTAFAAEELGLFGSRYQAGKAAAAGDKILMMINYDMIAYLANPSASPWHVNIIHYDNSAGLRDEAAEYCATNSELVPYTDNTNYNRSDSYSYYQNGYKALFYHQNEFESTYHTLGDVTSVCNFQYCREIVMASCALLVDKNY
jgi:hypothetical protein